MNGQGIIVGAAMDMISRETMDIDTFELLLKSSYWSSVEASTIKLEIEDWLRCQGFKLKPENQSFLGVNELYLGPNIRERRYNPERSNRFLLSAHKDTSRQLFLSLISKTRLPNFLQIQRLDTVMEVHLDLNMTILSVDISDMVLNENCSCWFKGCEWVSPPELTELNDLSELTFYFSINRTKKVRIYFPTNSTIRCECEIRDGRFWNRLTKEFQNSTDLNFSEIQMYLRATYIECVKPNIPLIKVPELQSKISHLISYMESSLRTGAEFHRYFPPDSDWFLTSHLVPNLKATTPHTIAFTRLLKYIAGLDVNTLYSLECGHRLVIPKQRFFDFFDVKRLRSDRLMNLIDIFKSYVLLVDLNTKNSFIVQKTQVNQTMSLFGLQSCVIRPLLMDFLITNRHVTFFVSPDFLEFESANTLSNFPRVAWWQLTDDFAFYLYSILCNKFYLNLFSKSTPQMVLSDAVTISVSDDSISILLYPSLSSYTRHIYVYDCYTVCFLLNTTATVTIRSESDLKLLKAVSSFDRYLKSFNEIHCRTFTEITIFRPKCP